MADLRTITRWPRCLLEQNLLPRLFARRVQHVSGPESIDCGPDDVIAISVVRNGELHIRSFIEHHLRVGVRHIVLLDTGSTDATVTIARRYDRLTVLRTSAPYARYENTMKRYLARRFARNRWHLAVDVDERFDHPFSDQVPLAAFIRYLNRHSYTAVVAQMLDLFPDTSLSELGSGSEFLKTHRWYDLSAIQRTEYEWGRVSDPAIRLHRGGIRSSLFGTRNGLSKAALAFTGDTVELFAGWHHTRGTRVADVSCVLLHYPFAGDFREKVRDAATTGRYGRSATHEYMRYWEVLREFPARRLRAATAREYVHVDALVEEGFLAVSNAYRDWVAVHRAPRERAAAPGCSDG